MAMVTLIRQAAPFGYVPGAIHAGLTGTGVIAIQGLIGCKVDITTLPTQLCDLRLARRTFRPRFLTFGTPDGYPTSIRIDHNPQLALPARCGPTRTWPRFIQGSWRQ